MQLDFVLRAHHFAILAIPIRLVRIAQQGIPQGSLDCVPRVLQIVIIVLLGMFVMDARVGIY